MTDVDIELSFYGTRQQCTTNFKVGYQLIG